MIDSPTDSATPDESPQDAPGSARPSAYPALVGRTLEQLTELLHGELGEPKFRAAQVYQWLHHHRVSEFDAMTNLPKQLRNALAERFVALPVRVAERQKSSDGSTKFLFELLADGRYVEGVLMPDRNRWTLCISSQVGCAVDCKFCMTAQLGFQRNLTPGEIVSQVLLAANEPGIDQAAREGAFPLTNVVFMGMGEPMLNVKNVIAAVHELTRRDELGIGMAPRRVTVSTAGHVPGIQALGDSGTNASLAISLNATTDPQRSEIMPINSKWPIGRLLDAARAFPLPRGRRITFEYVMLRDFNDSLGDARRLVDLLSGIHAKVNLIPFNPDPSLPFERPEEATVDAFAAVLRDAHLTVSVRWSKGLDVDAACGQLAGKWRPSATGSA